jgi:hypothetical protein
MEFGTYLGGARAILVTDLPIYEVERRINQHVGTLFGPEKTQASGWASFGQLRLWHQAQPMAGDRVLAGRIRPREGGSVLHLHYRTPWPLVVFTAVMCIGFAAYMLWTIIDDGNVLALLFLAALSLGPIAYLFPGEENAEREMGHLLDFLRETLDARDTEATPPAPG